MSSSIIHPHSDTDYSGISNITKMGRAGPVGSKGGDPIIIQDFGRKSFTNDVIKSISHQAQRNFIKGVYELRQNRKSIRSMDDLLKFWYPTLFKETDDVFTKANDAFTTLDTAAYNPIYGAAVWSQLSLRSEIFRLFDKEPWVQSGWKVKATRGTTANTGGFAVEVDNATLGALPDTVHPGYIDVTTKPKTVVTTFNVSLVEQLLGQSGGDDMFANPLEQLRSDMAVEHMRLFTEHLCTDVDTLAGNNMESLDRIFSNNDEATDGGIALDANDADIYGLDRDGATSWADSQVLHNGGTDRDLTIALLDAMIESVAKYTGDGDRQAFITGWDTATRISQLRSPQVQITNLEEVSIRPTMNGIAPPEAGRDIGLIASAYKKRPIIVNDAIPVDTISRIYLANLETTKIRTLLPTQYFEAGVTTTGNPWANDNLGDEGAFVTILEVICKQFNANCKLRDLQ